MSEDIALHLERMKRFGTYIELDWGEDDNLWSLTWISGGDCYRGQHSELDTLLRSVLEEVWREKLSKGGFS